MTTFEVTEFLLFVSGFLPVLSVETDWMFDILPVQVSPGLSVQREAAVSRKVRAISRAAHWVPPWWPWGRLHARRRRRLQLWPGSASGSASRPPAAPGSCQRPRRSGSRPTPARGFLYLDCNQRVEYSSKLYCFITYYEDFITNSEWIGNCIGSTVDRVPTMAV